MIIDIMGFIYILLTLVACFILACLARRFGSYGFLNGFMSKEQADDVFPEWKKKDK